VDDELKAKLQGLFDADKQRKETVVKQIDERQEREKQFMLDFSRVREEVIRPTFEELSTFVNGQGWQTDISVEDEDRHDHSGKVEARARITLSFFRDKPNYHRWHDYPHFSIMPDKRAAEVTFHTSTIGPGHGGQSGGAGSAKLDQLKPEFIQERAVEFVKKLLGDAKPYAR
jgi:hypothetical protein